MTKKKKQPKLAKVIPLFKWVKVKKHKPGKALTRFQRMEALEDAVFQAMTEKDLFSNEVAAVLLGIIAAGICENQLDLFDVLLRLLERVREEEDRGA